MFVDLKLRLNINSVTSLNLLFIVEKRKDVKKLAKHLTRD